MSSDCDHRDPAVLAGLAATLNDSQIARHCGVTPQTIRYWRTKHGIELGESVNTRPGNRRYDTDRDYFRSIDTPVKAYVLGFIVADGSLHKGGKAVTIALQTGDSALLRRIADEMGCDAPLGRKIGRGFDGIPRETAVLHLCGRQLVDDLNSLGVHSDKSTTATFPRVPFGLERDLSRGLMDGDGYIGPRQFCLVGTDALVEGFADAVRRHTGCSLDLRRRASSGHLYAYGYRRDAEALRWMYGGAVISLDRKTFAFRDYWTRPDVQSL